VHNIVKAKPRCQTSVYAT